MRCHACSYVIPLRYRLQLGLTLEFRCPYCGAYYKVDRGQSRRASICLLTALIGVVGVVFYFKWTGQISSTAYVHLFAALTLLFLLTDILLNALSRVVLQNSKPRCQSKFTRLASFSSVFLFLLLWALQEQMLENVPDVLQMSLLIALLSMSLVFFVMASLRE